MNQEGRESHSILVVDDEAVIITQLEEMLTALGYNVVGKASSGSDGIRLARELTPDVVLMDVVMPGEIDGISACGTIQREMDIPVILLTAYGDDTHIARAKSVHPYGYIIKPSQNDQIKAAVEIVIEKKAMERNLDGMMSGLRHKAEDRRLQLKEIHHRIKNNLNMITALLALQSMHSKSVECIEALQAVRSRVLTIAKIHEKLHASDDVDSIACEEYFRSIIGGILRANRSENVELVLDCADLKLEPDKLMPIGLILNELVSNAVRYAFPGTTAGRVDVMFGRVGHAYELVVADDGCGLPPSLDPETSTTLGLELVRSLVGQVGGIMHLDRDSGTRFKVQFPV